MSPPPTSPHTISTPSPHDAHNSPIRTHSRRLLALCFTAFLFLVLTGTFLHWDPAQSRENRNLAKPPAWPHNYSEAKNFSAQAMVFFRDHFGFRNAMIRAVALGKYHGLGPEVNNRIIVGKSGWLFYSKDEKFLADRGLDPFSDSDLLNWQTLLEKRQKWFANRNIPFIVLIAPDKQTIYPEFLPDEFTASPTPSRLDQLISYLQKNNSPVQILDLRPALLEAKKHQQIYFKTDSHWNDFGAYTAYRGTMTAVQHALPTRKFTPLTMEDFLACPISKAGDLAQQLDLYFEYQEKTTELVRRDLANKPDAFTNLPKVKFVDGPDPSAPRLLTYNDSFTGPLIQFLAPNFSHAVFHWNPITEDIDPAPTIQENPDIVISEFVERKLHEPIPTDPPEIANIKITAKE